MEATSPGSDILTADESLERMRAASAAFYAAAIQTQCHAFIEFTGLMNEYIKVCEQACARGTDFRTANVHTGQRLTWESFQRSYVNEKLECIFGGVIELRS